MQSRFGAVDPREHDFPFHLDTFTPLFMIPNIIIDYELFEPRDISFTEPPSLW